MQFRTILVPTDFSDSSRQALHYAVRFAKEFGSSLLILHVLEDLPILSPSSYEGLNLGVYQQRMMEDSRQLLERLVRETPDLGDARTVTRIRTGVPYREIIEESKESAADLIITSTHGRSGLTHFLLGSVAEKVVRNAPCPVLTIKTLNPVQSPPG